MSLLVYESYTYVIRGILFCVPAAFQWVGQKIAQCLSCGEEKGEEEVGGGGGGGKGQQRACRRERQRQKEEDQAYRQVQTYDYEQYG